MFRRKSKSKSKSAAKASRPSPPSSASSTSSTPKPPPAPTPASYESAAAASLSESSSSTVAFHGLLTAAPPNLTRTARPSDPPPLPLHVHPSHDSHPASPPPPHTVLTATAMTMPYTIIVPAPGHHSRLSSLVAPVFAAAHALLNAWNPDSEISRLNAAKPGRKHPLSPALARLLHRAADLHTLTDARFDPTTGTLSALFENALRDTAHPPPKSHLSALRFAVGWSRLDLTPTTLTRHNAHTRLDLDAFSKGHVIDTLVHTLVANGYPDCYVDWAGDIRAAGRHPAARPWRAALVHPPPLPRLFAHWRNNTLPHMLAPSDARYLVNLTPAHPAIATSGDYLSLLKYGFHHIAHPSSLSLLKAGRTSVASVAVVAESCLLADALATAAMTCPTLLDAKQFLQSVQHRRPAAVHGFAIMSRADHPDHAAYFTPGLFEPIPQDSPAPPPPSSPSPSPSDAPLPAVHRRHIPVVGFRATLESSNNAALPMHGLVSCSMHPVPLATFLTSAPRDAVPAGALLECQVLAGGGGPPHDDAPSGLSLRLQVTNVYDLPGGGGALVAAEVVDAEVSPAACAHARCGARVVKVPAVAYDMPLAKMRLEPAITRVRQLFRQVPAAVWVVTTAALADAGAAAVTATSVAVGEHGAGVVCFNVGHSSRFFAGLGGGGVRVTAYLMGSGGGGGAQLADRYVKVGEVGQGGEDQLTAAAVLVVHGSVVDVHDVGDHGVVVATVDEVLEVASEEQALVWFNGGFLKNSKN